MRSSEHIDNKNKNILILWEGPTQGLDILHSQYNHDGAETSVI